MENATKALIIAGALLLTIAIIAIGMMVYTQSQNIAADVPLDSFQIASHNNRFLVYTGKQQKGSAILGLPSETLSYNMALTDPLMKVKIIYREIGQNKAVTDTVLLGIDPNVASDVDGSNRLLHQDDLTKIKSTKQYRVIAEYSQAGAIVKLTIIEAN